MEIDYKVSTATLNRKLGLSIESVNEWAKLGMPVTEEVFTAVVAGLGKVGMPVTEEIFIAVVAHACELSSQCAASNPIADGEQRPKRQTKQRRTGGKSPLENRTSYRPPK